jgi:hypothetical protein
MTPETITRLVETLQTTAPVEYLPRHLQDFVADYWPLITEDMSPARCAAEFIARGNGVAVVG